MDRARATSPLAGCFARRSSPAPFRLSKSSEGQGLLRAYGLYRLGFHNRRTSSSRSS